jgi:hypothetical protein
MRLRRERVRSRLRDSGLSLLFGGKEIGESGDDGDRAGGCENEVSSN